MTFIPKLTIALSLFAIVACAPASESERTGNWTLSPAESGMTYVTIKNGNLGEINTFRDISGVVTPNGKAEFKISLDSVDTNNEIRDPRMKEYIFKTDQFSHAKVTADLNMTQFDVLAIGNSKTVLLDMTIDLAGIQNNEEFYVLVTRLGPNKVRVDNKAPLLLDAEDFGFEAGLAKLQELAGLNSISPVVSTTVSLTFQR